MSELAAQAGVNPQTLRYYERRGLLAEPARASGGYRAYPAEAVRGVHGAILRSFAATGHPPDAPSPVLPCRGSAT